MTETLANAKGLPCEEALHAAQATKPAPDRLDREEIPGRDTLQAYHARREVLQVLLTDMLAAEHYDRQTHDHHRWIDRRDEVKQLVQELQHMRRRIGFSGIDASDDIRYGENCVLALGSPPSHGYISAAAVLLAALNCVDDFPEGICYHCCAQIEPMWVACPWCGNIRNADWKLLHDTTQREAVEQLMREHGVYSADELREFSRNEEAE